MTDKEKAKRYDEAIERAKEYQGLRSEMEIIFPELKESEDKKMMRVLIGGLKSYVDMYSEWYDGVSTSEIIAWLEKQGEQKPAWSEDDDVGLGDAMWAIEQARTIAKDENDMGNLWCAERWLKALKDRVQPKQWLSKEDEEIILKMMFVFTIRVFPSSEECGSFVDFLKSLKPTWKPSDEQMKFLWKYAKQNNYDGRILSSLYDDLKKL